jgi:hypothetical protein
VSAIALIAAARIHVFGTVADAFFNDQRQGLMVWTAPYGIELCQNEVVANLRQGSRP